ncbi:MAG: hypothetical protein ACXAAN_02660 [Candidatus Thorarchaeota archaeon]
MNREVGGMALPPSFTPKERKKKEQERRRAAELLKDEQQQKLAAARAKEIAKKALEKKAKRKRLTSDDFDEAREHAQQLASKIYGKMKEAEKAKEAARRLAPRSKRSKRREVSLKPSERTSKSNPAESVSEAIGKKLRKNQETRHKPREMSKPKESRKSTPKPKETPKPKTPAKKERKERLGPKANLGNPEVHGKKIGSKELLRKLVNGEYSALKKKKDFPQRMKEAEAHLDLLQKYKGQERLKYGDIAKIAKELNLDPQTVSNWLTKGMTPRLYTYMEWSTPKSGAIEKVRKLKEANGGVQGPADVNKRLGNYYLEPEERGSKFAKREEQKMLKYYQFLNRYSEGGNHLDIAKEVGLSESGVQAYLEGATPRWVGLAGQIPAETPREGYKWLPKKYDHGGHGGRWSDWIDVPEKVTDYKQIKEVLGKLEPLNNTDMRKWDSKYGDLPRDLNFIYLLGVTVSDSNVPSSSTGAISMGMNLSKSYSWSETFGDATCFYLGQCGIRAGRVKDAPSAVAEIMTKTGIKEIHSEEQYKWMSENSPFLRWVRRSCLGYDDSAKTYQATDADWILRAPPKYRLAFLRGIADGDGGVSKSGYYFSISTHSDHDMLGKLLSSFDIQTYKSKTYIKTNGLVSLKQATDIIPFRHAATRMESLSKVRAMMDNRRGRIQSNPLSTEETRFIIEQRKRGLSYGGIDEALFDKYGYTLDPRSIWNIVNKKSMNAKKKNGEG